MSSRTYNNLGNRLLLGGGVQIHRVSSSGGTETRVLGAAIQSGVGFPRSGPSSNSGTTVRAGDGRGAPTSSIYIDENTGTQFFNEGTAKSPYWTPTSFDQRGLMGWTSDFRDGIGYPLATTSPATLTNAGSGLRMFGSEIEASDSGFVIAITEDGEVGTLQSSATSTYGVALGFGLGGTPTGLYEPDTNAPFVMDCNVAQHTAVTARQLFVGFTGSTIDALISPATGSGTTITLAETAAGDDCVGFYASSALTDAFVSWFNIYDAAGDHPVTISTTAAGINVGTVSTVEVYQRLRVEVYSDGSSALFINKALVGTNAAATNTVTTNLSPVICLTGTTTTVAAMLVKAPFSTWGVRA